MNYRKIFPSEYPKVTNIHFSAFPDFFLTKLGESFISTYYKTSLRNQESISICAIDNNEEIIGFSIGCIHSKGYHKKLIRQNFILFLIEGVKILFTKPKALFRLVNNFEKNAHVNDNGDYAELLSIGVKAEIKGGGIGKQLIQYFEEEARIRGCLKIALTTDSINNDNAINFYKKNGYEIFYEFTAYPNRKMYKLIKQLD